MPNLVYVAEIKEINPIENADKIVQARVDCGEGGVWNGVVQKDSFKLDDKCFVFLQDSILPPSEDYAFLQKGGWRIRMMRLRGCRSEVLILPFDPSKVDTEAEIGTDITEVFGVTKYSKELPANIGGNPKGHFPSFIPKTDEVNFQKVGKMIRFIRENKIPVYVTQKQDGCLDENTVVETENGNKTIREVCEQKIDNKVISYDERTEEFIFSDIVNSYITSKKKEWIEIELEDGRILKLTEDHKVWLPDLWCYRKASNLKIGDFLLKNRGIMERIAIKSIKKIESSSNLYDLETKSHNFFANEILVHNSSVTYFNHEGEFSACSRNLELKFDDASTIWNVARLHDLTRKMHGSEYAIQCEIVGPGIQKNPMGLEEVNIRIFNVYDIANREYLDYADVVSYCRHLEVLMVPVLNVNIYLPETDDELVEMAEGKYQNGKQQEGIVIRPMQETDFYGERMSFKVINLLYKD